VSTEDRPHDELIDRRRGADRREDVGLRSRQQRGPPGRPAVADAAGDDDEVGIQDVHQTADEVADLGAAGPDDLRGDSIRPGCGSLRYLFEGVRGARHELRDPPVVRPEQSRPGHDRLDMAGTATGAGNTRSGRRRHVSDMAGDVAPATVDPALDGDRSADAGSHRDEQDAGPADGSAGRQLTDQVGVHVVVDSDGQAEPPPQTLADTRSGPAVDGVGRGEDPAAARVDDTGSADSERLTGRHSPVDAGEVSDELGGRVQGGLGTRGRRGRDGGPRHDAAAGVDKGSGDLRATDVERSYER